MTSKMEKHSKANNSKHKKMKGQAIEKSPHTKNHNQNHFHKHSDNESHDTHSTEEDCVFNDPPRDRRHHRSRFDRQSHRSFSTSSTSITSSSSTSSVSSSSVSTSSPSTSSTSSTSSPSSSSDTDSDSSSPRVEPRHYRSCTDIPKKERYFDECDDTAPLLAKGEHVERNQKQDSVPKHGSSQGKCKISRDGNVRKAKSMESLARTQEKEPQDDAEQEKRSNEARKNIVKEKIKFSAFLNEITRQVLSPMRLTSLGVANPHRPRSPVQSTKLENTKMKQTEQQRHLQGSADSTSSGKHSHSSTKHSHSHQRHYSHRSEGSPDRKRSSFKRHHSWHRSRSPSDKHHRYYHHHHQYRNSGNEKDYHNYRHNHGPTYDTRTSRHKTKHHHRYNSEHQPNTSHCYKDCEHNQKSCHGDYTETRRSMSPTHHRHHSEARHNSQGEKCKDKDCHSPDSYQEELHFEEHHHSHQPQRPHRHQNEHNHLRKKQHGSNHIQHHYHQYESAHHHGNKDHHESHHHHGDHHQRGDRYSDPHHHGDSHSEGHHHRCLHSEAHNNQRDHYGDQNKDLHGHHRDHNREHNHQHGDHNRELRHHHGDQNRDSNHHHGDQNKNSHHHHGDKNREPHHHHGDNDGELHHLHGDRHIEPQNHHNHRDHEKRLHQHHGDRNRESHHRHGDHNRAPHYHHGDHKKEPHHHHGDPNREPHHHHGDHNREPHHHHGNPEREPHHHGGPDREPHHYHGDHAREPHHHHGDHDREPHHHHEDHPSQTSHSNLDDRYDSDQVQSQNNLGLITSHHGNPVKSPDTLRPVSASSQEEEQTSFSNPLHNETADGMGRIIILQEQNEGLQQSLLKTAVRVECLGEEFMSSRHCLEEELQKTRMELSNLTERFKRLHDNCSSTQQTNSFLEHKLHLVSQNMEGERKRLNTRISALTERLADAKFVNNMDTGKARQHQIQSDVDPTDSPIAPPPAQFMDSMNDNIDIEAGQEQCLGSVPEEEESDWSEIGEETPRFVLMGLNRGQAWRRSEGDEDQVNGLGREKIFQAHSSRPPTVPQLQFTVHNDALPLTQTLSDIVTCQSSYKITTNPSLGSAVLVRSASLEEIPLPRRTIAKELRGTEAMMDLHHSGAGAGHDLDNEFIHHLKSSRETALRRDCGVSEMDAAMSNLQSAERILNHLISETQQTEAEVHGWSQAIPDELLKGERTKL